ncbi:hypothetical protein ACJIZ3_014238 [Penstemon smallii]|uniref:Zinc finger GRF-type domain-containing protein n=1 Tax=Penstemon smallii TaxID=265156 RepID=A0ABD3RUF7_9LAMI
MESSSSSSGSTNNTGGGIEIQGRTCYCGSTVRMFTSRKQQNPGRRFIRCPGVCWVDQFVCDRAATIILGLMVRLNQLEGQYRTVETEMNRLEEQNRDLLVNFVQLESANNALRYKLKLVLICVLVCLLALFWYV